MKLQLTLLAQSAYTCGAPFILPVKKTVSVDVDPATFRPFDTYFHGGEGYYIIGILVTHDDGTPL